MTARCIALIPAAGSGTRTGHATPKQYLPVAGVPMIVRTIDVLARVPAIDRIAVVVAPDDAHFTTLAFRPAIRERIDVLRVGGDSRAASVGNGLAALAGRADDADWVLVHDAARCGIDIAAVERLIARVTGDDGDAAGGILALPLDDTVKREVAPTDAAGASVAATVDRRGLWRAQTPQMFRLGVLRDALDGAYESGATVTDEASAVEAYGRRVLLVRGSPTNFKVTTAEDLRMMSRLQGSTNEQESP